jgi:hypothetical protein
VEDSGSFLDPFSDPEAVEGRPIEEVDADPHMVDMADVLEDESLAATQTAYEEEREKSYQYLHGGQGHDEEFEQIGVALSWWRLENGESTLDVLAGLAQEGIGYISNIESLYEYGFPRGSLEGTVKLDIENGPLAILALQVLGTLVPNLRPNVTTLITAITSSIPLEATPEEEQAIMDAHKARARARSDRLKQTMEASEDLRKLFSVGDDPLHQDASLN